MGRPRKLLEFLCKNLLVVKHLGKSDRFGLSLTINRGLHLLVAFISMFLASAPISAGVTSLIAGNAPQTVQLGQPMTPTTITPTGTPYEAQWLGQSFTYVGAANTGMLAPDHAYSFIGPKDIVQLPSGDYYVLDGDQVRKINRSTGQVTTVSLPALPQGLSPNASWGFGSNLGLDGNGNLYVQVDLNTILQIVNLASVPQVGAKITQSVGLYYFDVSQSGNVYSAQYASLNNSGGSGSVWVAQVGSAVSGNISSTLILSDSNMLGYNCGISCGAFDAGALTGIFVDSNHSDNLYITDAAGRVQKITQPIQSAPSGSLSASVTEFVRNIANNSSQSPSGMAFDSQGNFYFSFSQTIRKLPSGSGSTSSIVLSGLQGTAGYVINPAT